jgi:hypothetical protein
MAHTLTLAASFAAFFLPALAIFLVGISRVAKPVESPVRARR